MKNRLDVIKKKILEVFDDINKTNKKDLKFACNIFLILTVFFFVMTITNTRLERIYFGYMFILSFEEMLMLFLVKLNYNFKNKTHKKVLYSFLCLCCIASFLVFLLTFLPILFLFYVFNKIICFLNIEIFTRNLHIVALKITLYLFAYIFCMFTYKIYNKNICLYIFIIVIAFLIIYWIYNFIYKKSKFISYQEKYDYFYYSQKAIIYIINTITIFLSIAGLYFSKNLFFYILPIIIFSGIEQIILIYIQNKNEKQKFIINLYEELVILKEISYAQIQDFSCIKIKIKLSITPYIIESYKKYIESGNQKYKDIKFKRNTDKKVIFLIDILDKCKIMLTKEYKVYQDKEKNAFEKELMDNTENLAKYLTEMY